jgi:uncharacterized protein YegL
MNKPALICGVLTPLLLLLLGWPAPSAPPAAPEPIHVVVLLDVSGSMAQNDPRGVCRQALVTLLELLAQERPLVTIIAWNQQTQRLFGPRVIQPADIPTIHKSVDTVRITGGTDLHRAVVEAEQLIAARQADRHRTHVVVFSDDDIPTDQVTALNELAGKLAAREVAIHAIALGTAGTALEKLTKTTEGQMHRVAAAPDRIAGEACDRAIQLALAMLPQHLLLYSDGTTPLPVPREARSLTAILPQGGELIGPDRRPASSRRDAIVTRYTGWVVASVPRTPADWEGGWSVRDAAGRAAPGWALLFSDVRLAVAGPLAFQAHSHCRVPVLVHHPTLNRSLTIKVFLKPPNGVAYPATEQALPRPQEQTLTLLLPPVPAGGDYVLVAQAHNSEGRLVAELRRPVKVAPPAFEVRLLHRSTELYHSGQAGPSSVRLPAGQPIDIEVTPTGPGEIEELSGIVSVEDVGRARRVLGTMEVERGKGPAKLVMRQVLLGPACRLLIEATMKQVEQARDPISGRTARQVVERGGIWGLGVRVDDSPAPVPPPPAPPPAPTPPPAPPPPVKLFTAELLQTGREKSRHALSANGSGPSLRFLDPIELRLVPTAALPAEQMKSARPEVTLVASQSPRSLSVERDSRGWKCNLGNLAPGSYSIVARLETGGLPAQEKRYPFEVRPLLDSLTIKRLAKSYPQGAVAVLPVRIKLKDAGDRSALEDHPLRVMIFNEMLHRWQWRDERSFAPGRGRDPQGDRPPPGHPAGTGLSRHDALDRQLVPGHHARRAAHQQLQQPAPARCGRDAPRRRPTGPVCAGRQGL